MKTETVIQSRKDIPKKRRPIFEWMEIGHREYITLLDPETAFWALVKRDQLKQIIKKGKFLKKYSKKVQAFTQEMEDLRFTQRPSAVYFNPTEKCNLNCSYCYIPEKMRRDGQHMPESRLLEALNILKDYFDRSLPEGSIPQIIFHGAEPLLNRKAVFAGIEKHSKDFRFGIQTNATLLDRSTVEFLIEHNVSIGLSLDAPTAEIADLTRKNWNGQGIFSKVLAAMDQLRGYPNWSVICTITGKNYSQLTPLVEFLHGREVPTCMLNLLRYTMPDSRKIKCSDHAAVRHFIAALERSYELYRETGRKLVVANFANILLAIVAPSARRLMCDISPCGGGRCFFALSPDGDLFPCSEFIGLPSFNGGNLFTQTIEEILAGAPFQKVVGRKVEDISGCNTCAIRHFCGSPCPAEAHELNGNIATQGGFCAFYKEQAAYAFRLIANGKENSYLWDGWDSSMKQTFAW